MISRGKNAKKNNNSTHKLRYKNNFRINKSASCVIRNNNLKQRETIKRNSKKV
jgi:hypothetical protein